MKIGIIGGSGLYEMDGIERKRRVSVTTPFGNPSGPLLCGQLHSRDVVFLPRHGRGHRILPSELNHRANIYAMKKLGVTHIISVSAVGSLKEQYKPMDIVLIDQFFDRTKRSADLTFFGHGIVAHVPFAHPVCERLRQLVGRAGREAGATIHMGGTYVNMEGPSFSTLAESNFHRVMGWDVIGMTNYGEARCAREAEICYTTMAMVTDYDCWHESHETVSIEMIIDYLRKNVAMSQAILHKVVDGLDPATDCPCQHALANTIMTAPVVMPATMRKKLHLLIGKYLKQ